MIYNHYCKISFKLFRDLENVDHEIPEDLLLGLVKNFEILFGLWHVHLPQGLFGPMVSFQEPEILKKYNKNVTFFVKL